MGDPTTRGWVVGGSAGAAKPDGIGEMDRLLLIGLAVVTVAVGVVLVTGHMSALVFGGGWPRYRLADAPGIIARVVDRPGDPGRAWDEVSRGALPPGPVAWWATLAAVLAVPAVVAVLLQSRAANKPTSAAWAQRSDLRRLRVRGDGHGRLVVGTFAGHKIAVESRHSLLVLGPTQSGKSTGLAIPAILEWPGPVVATSVKGDLIADTLGWRAAKGEVFIYDPAACTSFQRSCWTPLDGCDTWAGAMRAAWELTTAAKAAVGGSMALADFWFAAGAKALAPLLLAAANSGATIADVARWVDREERDEPLTILRRLESDAVTAHEATFRREERGRSSLVQVMQAAVGAYLDPVVSASAARSDIVVPELLDGGAHTLFITAPPDEQERFRPLFTTLLGQIISAVYRSAGSTGRPLDPPLLLVLDEAANIAPVPNLPTIASTAASHGLQLITVFQDLAQIRQRYGDASGTVVNNHRAKLLLPAQSDLDTLDLASRLIGEEEIERDSRTTDATGRRSSTTGTQWRRLLPPEAACRLRDGEGVLLYGNLPPVQLRLRPFYRDRRLKHRARHQHDPLPPADTAPDVAPPQPPMPAPDPDGPEVVSILDAARARRRARR